MRQRSLDRGSHCLEAEMGHQGRGSRHRTAGEIDMLNARRL